MGRVRGGDESRVDGWAVAPPVDGWAAAPPGRLWARQRTIWERGQRRHRATRRTTLMFRTSPSGRTAASVPGDASARWVSSKLGKCGGGAQRLSQRRGVSSACLCKGGARRGTPRPSMRQWGRATGSHRGGRQEAIDAAGANRGGDSAAVTRARTPGLGRGTRVGAARQRGALGAASTP